MGYGRNAKEASYDTFEQFVDNFAVAHSTTATTVKPLTQSKANLQAFAATVIISGIPTFHCVHFERL